VEDKREEKRLRMRIAFKLTHTPNAIETNFFKKNLKSWPLQLFDFLEKKN
jgi:hypothetical protein